MKQLLLLLIVFLSSCSSADLEKENEALRMQVQELQQEVSRQSELAQEAAATAREAQAEAERQVELAEIQAKAAQKALENCK